MLILFLAWIEFIVLVIATGILIIKLMDGIEETQSYSRKHVAEPPAPYGLSWLEMQIATYRVLRADRKRPYRMGR